MDIGTKVNFIRRTKEDAVVNGRGIIKAIFLDPNNHKSAQVIYKNEEGKEETQNILWQAINPTLEFEKAFTELVAQVSEIAKEGNAKVQEVVAEYNKKVEDAETALLGQPIKLEIE